MIILLISRSRLNAVQTFVWFDSEDGGESGREAVRVLKLSAAI